MFRIHRTDKMLFFAPRKWLFRNIHNIVYSVNKYSACVNTSLQNDVYITHAKRYTNSLVNDCNHCSWTQSSFVIARKWSNSLCMVLAKARTQSYILFFVGLVKFFPTLFSWHCRWKYSIWILLILSWILCWWARPTSSLETVSPPSRLLSRGRETRTNCRLSFSDLMISSATLKQKEQNSKGFRYAAEL